MAGGKETPRQKMIGMMYLVLTALLALNVSKQIIQAFIILNDKIESGNQIIQQKNAATLDTYDAKITTLKAQKALDQVKKIEATQAKALAIHDRTRYLCNFIITEASEMIKLSEGKDWTEEDPSVPVTDGKDPWIRLLPLGEIGGMDNYDIPTNYFVGDAANPNGKGVDILDSLISYRNSVCTMIANYEGDNGKSYSFTPFEVRPKYREDRNNASSEYGKALREALANANPEDTARLIQICNILTPEEMVKNHDEEVPWIVGQFDHAPIVAAAAFLTSLRSDALQAESIAQDLMASKAEAPIFKFNKIEPLAFARAGYINQGDSLAVKVYIAAYDSTETPKVRYWIDDSTRAQENMKESNGPVTIKDVGTGKHEVFGQIAVKERGAETWKNWRFPFEVGKPNGAIAMPEMLTLYKGYQNKIKASASGYPPDALTLTCAGCSVQRQGDGYIATVPLSATGTATMSLTAKSEQGSAQLAKEEFKISDFPPPTCFLANTENGKALSRGQVVGAPVLRLALVGSPLKADFTVTSFDVIVGNKKVSCQGNRMSPPALQAISTMQPGSNLAIQNVRYSGPGVMRAVAGTWTMR